MQIGPYHIDSKVILAPMAGVTDRPFRQLCKRLGAGMAISEMVSSNALLWKSEKTLRRIDHEGEPGPISVQIAGADPQQMAEAARFNVDHGAQIIDINMGCPAKKVCNVQAGSALLQNEALVDEITRTIVEAVDVPVTLKIRTGWDRANRNAINIARIAEANGIQALAIHGRTRADAYRGEAEYETIQAVKENIAIPVIANGDISSPQKAKFVLDTTGADAIMIGRAAQGNPWVFREVNHYLETGTEMDKPSLEEVRSTLLEHLHNLYDFYGEYSGVRVARKHISWYSKGQRDGGAFRQAVNQVESSAEQIKMIEKFFDELSAREGLAA